MKNFIALYCIFIPITTGLPDRFVFRINADIRDVEENLRAFHFVDKLEITPNVYSFKYTGGDSPKRSTHRDEVVSEVKKALGDKIFEIEQAKEYTKWVPLDYTDAMSDVSEKDIGIDDTQKQLSNQEIENYFGMNVENAWSQGYNGSGINVAVVDIGVNADIVDLSSNLNMDLAFNFIDETTDVTPEFFPSYGTESSSYVNHGNRCASIIGAVKDNGVCNAGIAFGTKIVPLKVFSLKHDYFMFRLSTSSDIIAAALTHGLQQIQIFSNSWAVSTTFEPLDIGLKEAILHGAATGRNCLGSIYVVPDGSDGISGSGLANNIYTIAVNSVGVHGTLPTKPQVSACVLTSGLGEGNRLHTDHMMTSSFKSACTGSFKGVSAVVAEVSAIIALVLQARSDLTLRDVQHLLVESSDWQQLEVSDSFKRNGAGKFFNYFLGFGLVDAGKIVNLAETWELVGNMHSDPLSFENIRTVPIENIHTCSNRANRQSTLTFRMAENKCFPHVSKIEHVVLHFKHYILNQEDMCIEIVSPSGTASLVVQNANITNLSDDTSPRDLASVHFWGETPYGLWNVRLHYRYEIDEEHLKSMQVFVVGTFNKSSRNEECALSSKEMKQKNSSSTSGHKQLFNFMNILSVMGLAFSCLGFVMYKWYSFGYTI